MSKTNIAKALAALVLVAVVFLTGLYFGRTGGPGEFTVTTEYAVGAVDAAELEALSQRLADRAARDTGETAPVEGDTHITPQPPVSESGDGLVNINTAEADALMTLPGVGPAIAQRIIDHREAHGPFRIIEEITDVSGIGSARFADIRDLITVE
ncbi:MAG: ComEA family DNA-binding protein [Oscillospiraceae bacterium]|nr:ComEA family DNA-binding protein [Oscillospiraceae bacterium]